MTEKQPNMNSGNNAVSSSPIGTGVVSEYAQELIHTLRLEPHPEGGWYRRDWESAEKDVNARPIGSLIYFLLPAGDASDWHKVDADEIWLWHGPGSVSLQFGGYGEHPESQDDSLHTVLLGKNGHVITGHAVVPAGCWQRTLPGSADALVSCVVSPGFTFEGFTLEADI